MGKVLLAGAHDDQVDEVRAGLTRAALKVPLHSQETLTDKLLEAHLPQ